MLKTLTNPSSVKSGGEETYADEEEDTQEVGIDDETTPGDSDQKANYFGGNKNTVNRKIMRTTKVWSFIGNFSNSIQRELLELGSNNSCGPTLMQIHPSGQLIGVIYGQSVLAFYDLAPLTVRLASVTDLLSPTNSTAALFGGNSVVGINLSHIAIFPLIVRGQLCIPGETFASNFNDALSSEGNSITEYAIHSLVFHPSHPLFSLCITRKRHFSSFSYGAQVQLPQSNSLFTRKVKNRGNGSIVEIPIAGGSTSAIPMVPLWCTFSMLNLLTVHPNDSLSLNTVWRKDQELLIPISIQDLSEIAQYSNTTTDLDNGLSTSCGINCDPVSFEFTPCSNHLVMRFRMIVSISQLNSSVSQISTDNIQGAPVAGTGVNSDAGMGNVAVDPLMKSCEGNILSLKEEHLILCCKLRSTANGYNHHDWLWYNQGAIFSNLPSTPLSVFYYGLEAWSKFARYRLAPTSKTDGKKLLSQSVDNWNTITKYECFLMNEPANATSLKESKCLSQKLGLPKTVMLQPVYLNISTPSLVSEREKNKYSLCFRVVEIDPIKASNLRQQSDTVNPSSSVIGSFPGFLTDEIAKQMILSTYSWCQLQQGDYWLPSTSEYVANEKRFLEDLAINSINSNPEVNSTSIDIKYHIFPYEIAVWDHHDNQNVSTPIGSEHIVEDFFSSGIICIKARLCKSLHYGMNYDENQYNKKYYDIDAARNQEGSYKVNNGAPIILLMKFETMSPDHGNVDSSIYKPGSDSTAVVLNFRDAIYIPAHSEKTVYNTGTIIALASNSNELKVLQLRNSATKSGSIKSYLTCVKMINLQFISQAPVEKLANFKINGIWTSKVTAKSPPDLLVHIEHEDVSRGGKLYRVSDAPKFFQIPYESLSFASSGTRSSSITDNMNMIDKLKPITNENFIRLWCGEKVLQYIESSSDSCFYDESFTQIPELANIFSPSMTAEGLDEVFLGILTNFRVIIVIRSTNQFDKTTWKILNSVQYASPKTDNRVNGNNADRNTALKQMSNLKQLNESVISIHWYGFSLLLFGDSGRIHYLLPCSETFSDHCKPSDLLPNSQFLTSYFQFLGRSIHGAVGANFPQAIVPTPNCLRSSLTTCSLFFSFPRNSFPSNTERFSTLPLAFTLPDSMLFYIPAPGVNSSLVATTAGSGEKRIIFPEFLVSTRPTNPYEVLLMGIIANRFRIEESKRSSSTENSFPAKSTSFIPSGIEKSSEMKTTVSTVWYDLVQTLLLFYTTNHNNQNAGGTNNLLPRYPASQHLITTLSLLKFVFSENTNSTLAADPSSNQYSDSDNTPTFLWTTVVFPLLSHSYNSILTDSICSKTLSEFTLTAISSKDCHYHNLYICYYLDNMLGEGKKKLRNEYTSQLSLVVWLYQVISHYQVPQWYELFTQQDTYGGSQFPLPQSTLSKLLTEFVQLVSEASNAKNDFESFSGLLLECLDISGNILATFEKLTSTPRFEHLIKKYVSEIFQEDWSLLNYALRQYTCEFIDDNTVHSDSFFSKNVRNCVKNLLQNNRKKSLWATLSGEYRNIHSNTEKTAESNPPTGYPSEKSFWHLMTKINQKVVLRRLGPIPASRPNKVNTNELMNVILARDVVEEYFGNISSLETIQEAGNVILGLFDDPSNQSGNSLDVQDSTKFFPGQILPIGWVENVGVFNNGNNRDCDKIVGYYRFSDVYFPSEVSLGYTNSYIPPSVATLVDLSRFEGQCSNLELFDFAGKGRNDDDEDSTTLSTVESQYSIDYTNSNVHPGEKHESMKLLCDLVHVPTNVPPTISTAFLSSGGSMPTSISKERIEHGLRCLIYRGSPLDVGMYHYNPTSKGTETAGNARNVCTMEWHWCCSQTAEELREELSFKPIVILQRSVYPEHNSQDQYDFLSYHSSSSGSSKSNSITSAGLEGLIWRLYITSEGYIGFSVGKFCDGTPSCSTILSTETIFTILQNASMVNNSFSEDGEGSVNATPYLHMVFIIDSGRSKIVSNPVSDGDYSLEYQDPLQVKLIVNNQVVLDNSISNKGSQALIPSIFESKLDRTFLYILPNCPLAYQLTEFRVWSGNTRTMQQLLDNKEQCLSLAEKRYRLMMQYKGTKKLFAPFRDITIQLCSSSQNIPILMPPRKGGVTGSTMKADNTISAAQPLKPFFTPPPLNDKKGVSPLITSNQSENSTIPKQLPSNNSATSSNSIASARQRRMNQLQQQKVQQVPIKLLPEKESEQGEIIKDAAVAVEKNNKTVLSNVDNNVEVTKVVSVSIENLKTSASLTSQEPMLIVTEKKLENNIKSEPNIKTEIKQISAVKEASVSSSFQTPSPVRNISYWCNDLFSKGFTVTPNRFVGFGETLSTAGLESSKLVLSPTIIFHLFKYFPENVVHENHSCNAAIVQVLMIQQNTVNQMVIKKLLVRSPSDFNEQSFVESPILLFSRMKPSHPYIIGVPTLTNIMFFDITNALHGKGEIDKSTDLPEGSFVGYLPISKFVTNSLSHEKLAFAYFLTSDLLVFLTTTEGFTIKIPPNSARGGEMVHSKPMKILHRIDNIR